MIKRLRPKLAALIIILFLALFDGPIVPIIGVQGGPQHTVIRRARQRRQGIIPNNNYRRSNNTGCGFFACLEGLFKSNKPKQQSSKLII